MKNSDRARIQVSNSRWSCKLAGHRLPFIPEAPRDRHIIAEVASKVQTASKFNLFPHEVGAANNADFYFTWHKNGIGSSKLPNPSRKSMIQREFADNVK